MGSRVFDGSNDSLDIDSALVTGVPLTVACWGKADSFASDGDLISVVDKDAAAEWFRLGVDAGGEIQVEQRSAGSGSTQNTQTAVTISTGTWFSAVGVFAALNDRSVYLNGGNKQSGTGAESAPGPIDRFSVGRTGDSSPSNFHDGKIQYVFLWDVALSDAEVADFHAGNIPQSGNLVEWWEFDGSSPEVGQISGTQLTVSGATYDGADSPPVTYGGGADKLLSGAAAGAASVTGSVVRDRSVSGAVDGDLVATGSVVRDRPVLGQADGDLVATGLVVRDRALVGESLGALEATGTVTKGGEVLLTGDVAGVLSAVGALVRERAFTGQAGGALVAEGTLVRERELIGEVNGLLSVTGTLVRDRFLVGTSNGVLFVQGNLILFVEEGDASLFRALLGHGQ